MADKEPKENLRYIMFQGIVYLRAEDVAGYLRALGGAEETDTRRRLETAASLLLAQGPPR